MQIAESQLRGVIRRIIMAGGSDESEAELVTDHLVRANLSGHDSHGVGMIPTYVKHLKAGLLKPNTGGKGQRMRAPSSSLMGVEGMGSASLWRRWTPP